ncbi:MAG TPA: DUF3078 domain-containing protein [Firmicutes bacterium]|nr:DUF3078 domain-containing protein [Bacillota bacterium]
MKRILFFAVFIAMMPFLWAGEAGESKGVYAKAEAEMETEGLNPRMNLFLNFANAGFNNWAAGGESSYSWQVNFDGSIDYSDNDILWINEFVLKYGRSEMQEAGSRKTADEVSFKSRYNRKVWEAIHPYAEISFETQLDSGFDYSGEEPVEISKIMDPAYMRQTAGIAFKPSQVFEVRAGLGFKQTVAGDFADRYIGPDGDFIENKAGASFSFHLNVSLMKNITLKSDLGFFSDFYSADTIDVKWESVITARVNEYINVRFDYVVLYDKNAVYAAQIKDILSVGVVYGFL